MGTPSAGSSVIEVLDFDLDVECPGAFGRGRWQRQRDLRAAGQVAARREGQLHPVALAAELPDLAEQRGLVDPLLEVDLERPTFPAVERVQPPAELLDARAELDVAHAARRGVALDRLAEDGRPTQHVVD